VRLPRDGPATTAHDEDSERAWDRAAELYDRGPYSVDITERFVWGADDDERTRS
jgi:hypothetical protein